jgi:hypothetical protein
MREKLKERAYDRH